MLELTGVTKTFPRNDGETDVLHALRDVTLSLPPGEMLAVQGPSGSGKTTLLLTAAGLLRPTSGTVRLDGTDFYSLVPEDRAGLRARSMGFVFQQFHLVSYLSVRDNVLLPALAAHVPHAGRRADELIERFGLADRASHKPAELSIGQRQRTALARALLTDPRVILADEPTGNLDGENAAEVMRALDECTRDGRAVLLVTHDPTAAEFAHRTCLLREGRLEQASTQPVAGR
jgi:putative ABC transport system ATP-binding protein